MKEEALKLADEILLCTTDPLHSKTSAMIRRLVEELDKQQIETAKVTTQFVIVADENNKLKNQLDKQGKPVAWMNPSQVLHGVIDARTYYLNGFIPLYTTPQTKPLKCIVKDCENHRHEGGFTGDLCNPCYEFITTGKGIYSQAYRNTQTKPLSDEEILHIYSESYRNTLMGIDPLVFAREIEERHGIK